MKAAVGGVAKLAPKPTKLPAVAATAVRKKQRRDSPLFISYSEATGLPSRVVNSLSGLRGRGVEQDRLGLMPAIAILLPYYLKSRQSAAAPKSNASQSDGVRRLRSLIGCVSRETLKPMPNVQSVAQA